MTNPYGDGVDKPPRRINAIAVIGGLVIGFIVTCVWVAVVLIGAYSVSSTGNTTTGEDVVIVVVLLLPIAGAVALLCFPRSRQAGAGLVMGMAIGTLVLAGICGAMFLPGLGA